MHGKRISVTRIARHTGLVESSINYIKRTVSSTFLRETAGIECVGFAATPLPLLCADESALSSPEAVCAVSDGRRPLKKFIIGGRRPCAIVSGGAVRVVRYGYRNVKDKW